MLVADARCGVRSRETTTASFREAFDATQGQGLPYSMESREYGIRANSILPGIIETAQSRDQLNDKEWATC